MIKTRYHLGFTIVELLIVIAVIGILATIAIAYYRGSEDRAHNTQTIAGVSQYMTAIDLFVLRTGDYPKTGPEIDNEHIAAVCLGAGYEGRTCGRVTYVDIYEDDYFNNQLASIVGVQPSTISTINREVGPESFVGAVYGIDYIGLEPIGLGVGEVHARTIQYALFGANADCKLSGAKPYRLQDDPPMTACIIVLEQLPNYGT